MVGRQLRWTYRWWLVVQPLYPCLPEFPMGRRSVSGREHMVHVENTDSFEIKHDDGAMHCVIIRCLLMALCSESVNIIDGKLSFPLNQFVVSKDYVEHVFHQMLRIWILCSETLFNKTFAHNDAFCRSPIRTPEVASSHVSNIQTWRELVLVSAGDMLCFCLGHFGHVKENGVMSLKSTKVRGHTCHLCIEKIFAQKNLFLLFKCVC